MRPTLKLAILFFFLIVFLPQVHADLPQTVDNDSQQPVVPAATSETETIVNPALPTQVPPSPLQQATTPIPEGLVPDDYRPTGNVEEVQDPNGKVLYRVTVYQLDATDMDETNGYVAHREGELRLVENWDDTLNAYVFSGQQIETKTTIDPTRKNPEGFEEMQTDSYEIADGQRFLDFRTYLLKSYQKIGEEGYIRHEENWTIRYMYGADANENKVGYETLQMQTIKGEKEIYSEETNRWHGQSKDWQERETIHQETHRFDTAYVLNRKSQLIMRHFRPDGILESQDTETSSNYAISGLTWEGWLTNHTQKDELEHVLYDVTGQNVLTTEYSVIDREEKLRNHQVIFDSVLSEKKVDDQVQEKFSRQTGLRNNQTFDFLNIEYVTLADGQESKESLNLNWSADGNGIQNLKINDAPQWLPMADMDKKKQWLVEHLQHFAKLDAQLTGSFSAASYPYLSDPEFTPAS